jgi:hypothetical protein
MTINKSKFIREFVATGLWYWYGDESDCVEVTTYRDGNGVHWQVTPNIWTSPKLVELSITRTDHKGHATRCYAYYKNTCGNELSYHNFKSVIR